MFLLCLFVECRKIQFDSLFLHRTEWQHVGVKVKQLL